MTTLEHRTALVTGASGGLGPAIAHVLARHGCKLVLSGRNQTALSGLSAALEQNGASVTVVAVDLSEPAAAKELASRASAAVGPLDILVNAAGIEVAAPFVATTPAELELVVRVDLLAALLLTRELLPDMLDRGRGHVVNISSIGGKGAVPYDAAYAAAKWGLVGMTQSLRAEYAGAPVGFSVVCPGFVTGAGMFARAEARGVRAPWAFGTTTPEHVALAVARAIRDDLPEVIVTPRPVRPMLAFASLFPRAAERLAAAMGTTRFARAAARAHGRL